MYKTNMKFNVFSTIFFYSLHNATLLFNCKLNRLYDIFSCLSQSEDKKSSVLSVKTEFMRGYERVYYNVHV